MKEKNRPPIGLIPRRLHEELNFDDTSSHIRVEEIDNAIDRFNRAGKPIPEEWLNEKTEILDINK